MADLTDEALQVLVDATPAESVNGRIYRELQARRAADPTEAQRGWYRETSDFFSRLVRERNCWPDVAYDYARLAAHFGRLALGQREEE